MLAMCARVEPACMAAPSPGAYVTASFFSRCSMLMPGLRSSVSEPLAPFTVTFSEATVAVTPCGRSIAAFATLLMVFSGDDAQHFAALTDRAGLAVGHDALRRRDDDGAHPAENLRELILPA